MDQQPGQQPPTQGIERRTLKNFSTPYRCTNRPVLHGLVHCRYNLLAAQEIVVIDADE